MRTGHQEGIITINVGEGNDARREAIRAHLHKPYRTLQKHYDGGPDPDWAQTHISAYASAHPWEDWAETWAHYLHMVDTLDVAMDAGIHSEHPADLKDPFGADVLYSPAGDTSPPDTAFLSFLNAWTRLTSRARRVLAGHGPAGPVSLCAEQTLRHQAALGAPLHRGTARPHHAL